MRIAIDVREYSHTPAGIGNYCAGLVSALARLPAEEEFVLYGHSLFPAEAVGKSFRHRLVGDGWRRGWRRTVWENLALPFDLLRQRVDVFHATSHIVPPPWHGGALVFTVHDMTNFLFPDWYPARNNAYRSRMIRRGVRYARAIVAVSRSTADDIARLFPNAQSKVKVVHEGVSPIFSPTSPPSPPPLPSGCEGRFLLFVGTLSPRKNVARLLEAFHRFTREPRNADIHLVLAGMRGWKCDDVTVSSQELGLEDRVRHVGFTSQEQLAEMYRQALLVCLPSLYEGFGLPVLEAMASGTPVLASNRSSLPEIVADTSSLVDPENVEEIADRMDSLVNDRSLRERLVREGLQRAMDFTWEWAARETLEVYREAG